MMNEENWLTAKLAAIRGGANTAVPSLISLGHVLLYFLHDYRFD
jgi:hypothetical protein